MVAGVQKADHKCCHNWVVVSIESFDYNLDSNNQNMTVVVVAEQIHCVLCAVRVAVFGQNMGSSGLALDRIVNTTAVAAVAVEDLIGQHLMGHSLEIPGIDSKAEVGSQQ